MSAVLDAVVIGAGHNGLAAAAYLARAGLVGGGAASGATSPAAPA